VVSWTLRASAFPSCPNPLTSGPIPHQRLFAVMRWCGAGFRAVLAMVGRSSKLVGIVERRKDWVILAGE
jgi:hypothetical protein